MSSRGECRRFTLGVATLFGFRRGFFIPCRFAAEGTAAGDRCPYPSLAPLFAAGRSRFEAWIARIDGYADALQALGGPPPGPRWDQDWFPRLDAAIAYAVVRTLRPARLVEVGAGHSTRFFIRAAADAGYPLALTAIDPAPRAELGTAGVRLLQKSVQDAGEAPFAPLGPGDVLSIDSSHVLMPGSDVDMLLNRVLPLLPAGAIVHVHDIFLPDPYPAAWAWRGYNEQQGVAALLQGSAWRILWASHFVRTACADLLADSILNRLPLMPGAHEASLWLEKRSLPPCE
ncbi:MAG: class I SAM-dependent methyltransferase [Defluviicoccus sp.]